MEVIMNKDTLEWFYSFSLLHPLLALLPASWSHFWPRLLVIDIIVSAPREPVLFVWEDTWMFVKNTKSPGATRSAGFLPSAPDHVWNIDSASWQFSVFLGFLDLDAYFISDSALSQLLSPLFKVKHLQLTVVHSELPVFSLPHWLIGEGRG